MTYALTLLLRATIAGGEAGGGVGVLLGEGEVGNMLWEEEFTGEDEEGGNELLFLLLLLSNIVLIFLLMPLWELLTLLVLELLALLELLTLLELPTSFADAARLSSSSSL